MDASTSWGIGGCAGPFYFSVSNKDLEGIFALYGRCPNKTHFEIPEHRLPIAYIELIAALVGFSLFSPKTPSTLISLFSDNTDVVAWLRKSRCAAGIGFKILAGIEFYKKKHILKISPKHIPGSDNVSADCLSRGKIPNHLRERGTRLWADIDLLIRLIQQPLMFWDGLNQSTN